MREGVGDAGEGRRRGVHRALHRGRVGDGRVSDGEGGIRRAFLSTNARNAVIEDARDASPDEACGLLVGRVEEARVRVLRAVPCTNEAPADRRSTRFTIDPRRVIEEERALRGSGEGIVGFYHSHPAGQPVPSSVDRGYMEFWPEVLWLIVGVGGADGDAALRAWGWDPGAPESPRELPIG
ncbi:MAG: M67 family peptidase [Gemmatimonadetes bacterium]|nr:M67 family peptidase [Gemmatimonadota bacterium]